MSLGEESAPREVPDPEEHERAQARRDRLREVMDRLERALAEPARHDVAAWRDSVSAVIDDLHVVLDDHAAETEAPRGLFDEVVQHAPRLTHQVGMLRDEHPALIGAAAALGQTLQAEIDDGFVTAVREEANALLGRLLRHRQEGADLLYEVYWVDIAAAD